jgi:hypothetical protein
VTTSAPDLGAWRSAATILAFVLGVVGGGESATEESAGQLGAQTQIPPGEVPGTTLEPAQASVACDATDPIATVPFHRILVTYRRDEMLPGATYHADDPKAIYHRYTIYQNEVDRLADHVMDRREYEGVMGYVLPECRSGVAPLYVLSHRERPFDQLYTVNVREARSAIENFGYHWDQWRGGNGDEDPTAGDPYAFVLTQPEPGTIPMYRVARETHLYTIDSGERDRAVSLGWTDEGVAFYVWPTQVLFPTPGATSAPTEPTNTDQPPTGEPDGEPPPVGPEYSPGGGEWPRPSSPRAFWITITLAVVLVVTSIGLALVVRKPR